MGARAPKGPGVRTAGSCRGGAVHCRAPLEGGTQGGPVGPEYRSGPLTRGLTIRCSRVAIAVRAASGLTRARGRCITNDTLRYNVAGAGEGACDMAEASLYERLGGVFAIAAVVDQFSDAVIANPKVGQGSENPQLDTWSTKRRDRLAGLKFMRTLWVCNVAGGPFEYVGTKPGSTAVGLEEAHRALEITPGEFDEVAGGAGTHPGRLRGSRAGEGRGPRGVRGAQGRGDRRRDAVAGTEPGRARRGRRVSSRPSPAPSRRPARRRGVRAPRTRRPAALSPPRTRRRRRPGAGGRSSSPRRSCR